MKIESRKEMGRLGRYKLHTNTATPVHGLDSLGLHLCSFYQPTVGCPADAQPHYYLSLGMDGRRFVMTLSHMELAELKQEIDAALKATQKPRRVK